jgi:hypothetical protein
MALSWNCGFGWWPVLTLVVAGVGVNLLRGPVVWILYVPFVVAGLYMTARFRLFTSQPWRRVHARIMAAYGRLAEQEYDSARKEGREYDIRTPCRALAERLSGQGLPGAPELLSDEERKGYYRGLVDACPQVFLKRIDPSKHTAILEGVRRDIDSSQLGPDILIAKAVELEHGRGEAANYLHALLLGRVRE